MSLATDAGLESVGAGQGLTLNASGLLDNDLSTGVGRLRAGKTPATNPSAFGDALVASGTGYPHQVEIGNSTGVCSLRVGQDATHSLGFTWSYNATPANASAILDVFGYNVPLKIDAATVHLQTISAGATIAGGLGLLGSAASGGNLLLASTTHATKGQVQIGGTTGLVYDEATKRLGIGISPTSTLHITGTAGSTSRLASQGAVNESQYTIINNNSTASLVLQASGSSNGGTAFGITDASVVSILSAAGLMKLGTSVATDLVFGTNNAEALRIDNATNRLKFTASSITANGAGAVTAPGAIGPAPIAVQEWLTVKNAAGTTRYIPLYG